MASIEYSFKSENKILKDEDKIQDGYYKSIVGIQIKKIVDGPEPCVINNKILDNFVDVITAEQIKFPIEINVGVASNLYDYEQIKRWFNGSNKDPLTNLIIEKEKQNYTPILNYCLLFLCLELKEDNTLVYHSPYGDIMNLLILSYYVINNATFSSTNMEKKYRGCPCLKTLDLREQNFYHEIRRTKIHNNFNKFIEMIEIIGICPVSKRSLYNNCTISDKGILLHGSLKNKKFIDKEVDCTLSAFNSYFQNLHEIKFNSSVIKYCFESDFDINLTIINKDDISVYNIASSYEFDTEKKNHELIYYIIEYSDDIKCNNKQAEEKEETEEKCNDKQEEEKEATQNDKLLPKKDNYYKILDLDKFSSNYNDKVYNLKHIIAHFISYNANYNFDMIYELNNMILELRSTKQVAIDFYDKNHESISPYQLTLIQKHYDEYCDIEQYNRMCCPDYDIISIRQLKKNYKIICFSPYENQHGDDYSMITINNNNLTKKMIKNKEFKDCSFFGTTFNNVEFINCKFVCCYFVKITGQLIFNKCKFDSNISFPDDLSKYTA